MELWSTDDFLARQLGMLIMEKELIIKEFIDPIDKDIQKLDLDERNQLTDWFMANQLTKNKRTITLLEYWENSSSVLLRRIF